MKKEEFKDKLKNAGLNQKKFAHMTGYSYSAVKGWKEVPKWVDYVINYIELAHKINDLDEVAKSIAPLKEKVQILDL